MLGDQRAINTMTLLIGLLSLLLLVSQLRRTI
jgi:hypothetical protein